MPINADKVHLWKADIAKSVDLYNEWFMQFAPATYRDTRLATTEQVEKALAWTANLTNVTPDLLRQYPNALFMLRMTTAPPLARDRLVGLAGVSKSLVERMEKKNILPQRMPTTDLNKDLAKICNLIMRLADKDIFPWLESENSLPSEAQVHRAATIVADRLCGAQSDPIIRNAQELRQLSAIRAWLEARGYTYIGIGEGARYNALTPGSFAFHVNVPGLQVGGLKEVNITVEAVIMPLTSRAGELPILLEAKSAGDFTNVNKRRKEEAAKMSQLRLKHGAGVRYILFLCGYFDSSYLGYEAAEGIDWVWEHRIDDLARFGV